MSTRTKILEACVCSRLFYCVVSVQAWKIGILKSIDKKQGLESQSKKYQNLMIWDWALLCNNEQLKEITKTSDTTE